MRFYKTEEQRRKYSGRTSWAHLSSDMGHTTASERPIEGRLLGVTSVLLLRRRFRSPTMPPPPPPLPDELVEEVLLRIPPENPAGLVRAGLVCRRWRRLVVSDPGFRRRFLDFHRRPPVLGMLCNTYGHIDSARFIPTTAFCTPRAGDMCVLDARHGRVLCKKGSSVLAVWDPIADEVVREIPLPQKYRALTQFSAAVICSAAGAGACGHLDCHDGPFLVVSVCFDFTSANTLIYTYSSEAAAWSEPVCAKKKCVTDFSTMGSALVGNALYFGDKMGRQALKYDLELCQASLIPLPPAPSVSWPPRLSSRLTTTEDGGLGLIDEGDSKLYMWSRNDAKWEKRVLELEIVFPVDVNVTKLSLIGSGVGIVFMNMGLEVYTIDLKTYEVKKVYKGKAHRIVPYVSFYTPALKAT